MNTAKIISLVSKSDINVTIDNVGCLTAERASQTTTVTECHEVQEPVELHIAFGCFEIELTA